VPYEICAERLRLADAVSHAEQSVQAAREFLLFAQSRQSDTGEHERELARLVMAHEEARANLKKHRKEHHC
jgi:hypothetical protein